MGRRATSTAIAITLDAKGPVRSHGIWPCWSKLNLPTLAAQGMSLVPPRRNAFAGRASLSSRELVLSSPLHHGSRHAARAGRLRLRFIGDPVDTALVVSVDVSGSVNHERYHAATMQATISARRCEDPVGARPDRRAALHGGILFAMVAWADKPHLVIDWQRHRLAGRRPRDRLLASRTLPQQVFRSSSFTWPS